MFKISAITNNQATHSVELTNLPANASIEIALSAAHQKLIAMGISYEEISVSFTRVCVDIQALNELFLTPNTRDERATEKAFELKAKEQQQTPS